MAEPTDVPGPTARYQAFLDAGEFRLQRSRSSGRFVFEPRLAEPLAGAEDLEWVPASGLGEVYALTIVRPRPPAEPYPVVLVDLAEGVRLMSTVVGIAPDAIVIGMAVKARITIEGDHGRLEFAPRP